MSRSFGRIAAPDANDKKFLMKALLSPTPVGRRYWWASGWWGDQGANPWCVDYAWHHWCVDGPVTHRQKGILWTPGHVYAEAQRLDEWEGESYDGTSVRAGAKALQTRGLIESYHWAWDVDDVVQAILTVGPVVVGTNWYTAMTHPNAAGLMKVSGALEGGHAYVLDGVDTATGLIRVKNSWGRGWGRKGFAAISMVDMDYLLAQGGEACLAVEKKK